jgi:hypothetical protein
MRSLGRLVRGLSALFWGLPLAFLVCYYTAKVESLKAFGAVPPLVCTGLLVYALGQLGAFQKQERVWRAALDRARLFALINFGLSPFLYWSNRMPDNCFFSVSVMVMVLSALVFLGCLNLVIRRLGAMLPDETLRLETRQFTALNLNLLTATFFFGALSVLLPRVPEPRSILYGTALVILERGSLWFLILLVLLPLAMTMALLWKTKEVILDNVFGAKPPVL